MESSVAPTPLQENFVTKMAQAQEPPLVSSEIQKSTSSGVGRLIQVMPQTIQY